MKPAISSKLSTKYQARIPEKVRSILDLHPGDSVVFEVAKDDKVFIRKARPIDFELARAIEGTLLSEWLSVYDKEAYSDL